MAFGAITENSCITVPAGGSIKTAAGVKFEHVESGHYIFHAAATRKTKEQQEAESKELRQRIAAARQYLSSKGAAGHAG